MKATIKKIIKETPRIKTFIVEPGEPVSFKTGQAMKWNLPDIKIGKLYSVVSPGGENLKELEFTIGIVPNGKFTPHVDLLKEGDVFELTGPFGRFLFDDEDTTDVALLAGGTGISVLRSIARHIIDNKLPIKTHLIFSILNKDEMVYKKELERLVAETDNFTMSWVVTEEHPEWKGRCGFVNKKMFDEDFGDYHQRFYVCGPEGFITCCEKILTESGVPEERINVDRWSFYKINDKK